MTKNIPKASSPAVFKTMSGNRGKDSKLEIVVKMPKTNTFFWHQRINRNIERDSEVSNHYLQENWILLRFWEHEVKQDLERVVKTIKYFVDEKREK